MQRLGLLITLFLVFAHPAMGALTVDTTSDGNDGECLIDCSIREAIDTAAAGETILVPAGTYSVSGGLISIDRDLTIVGEGARHTVIRGSMTPRRIFQIEAGASVQIFALSLSQEPGQSGGGIRNSGDLLLRECEVRDAVNPLDTGGGALRNTSTGTATIERCTLINNNAEFGGAIQNEGVLVLESTTVSGNSNAFIAGGILNLGGEITISGSTIIDNVAQLGGTGNIHNAVGSITLRNSVVSGGVGGPDCSGGIDSTPGHNLDGDGTCIASGGPGNLTAAALLGPLADNGGPLPTHAPASGSPLIDAGNPSVPGTSADACIAIDARGVGRPQGAVCDIGAFELAAGQNCAGGAADDTDGDGVCRADDNCSGGFNPGQSVVIFPHTLLASAADSFTWGQAAEVSFVRGDLDLVDVYGTNDSGDLTAVDSLLDGERPPDGSGFWYLVRLGGECTAGSWQTRPGGESERDLTLP